MSRFASTSVGTFAIVALLTISGCTAAEPSADPIESPATSAAPPPKKPRSDGKASAPEESIYEVKKPGREIGDGTRVRIAGPGLRVTASAGKMLFVQEAADDGACERDASVVAYRAIQVVLTEAPSVAVTRGSRVVVEGLVTTVGARRTIENATVTVLDEPIREYHPHCDRSSQALYTYPLDGVLVTTAGTFAVSSLDGSSRLETCFGDAIPIGTIMTTHEDCSRNWHWVTGIVVHSGSVSHVEPRDEDDIDGRTGNDACL